MKVTFPKADVLCVYGLPGHELYTDLREWLDEEQSRYLVILEDDEKALFHSHAQHERIRLCYGENEEALKTIAWEFVFLEFAYWHVPACSLKEPDKMEQLFAKMSFFQEGIHLVASDFKERGTDRLKNFIVNAERTHREGGSLFGQFKSIPAIICGAGPSLEQEIELVRSLEDRALIFAGGTCLSSLSLFGARPHFAGLVDPYFPSERMSLHQSHQTPLFFQNRVHPYLLKQWQGPFLKMAGTGTDHLEEKSFDGGWNVANFLTAITYQLGCNPIILVGVDLAQSKGKSYAGDLERTEGGDLIHVEGDLYTRKDWLFAAEWLGNFAKEHTDVQWINTSSQGLKIDGFEQKSLSEVSFPKSYDLDAKVHAEILAIEEKGGEKTEMLMGSFAKVEQLCTEILDLMEKLFPNLPEKSGAYALLQRDIESEIAFQRFLIPVWDVWKHVFARQVPKEIPPAFGIGLNQWLFMKGICKDARAI